LSRKEKEKEKHDKQTAPKSSPSLTRRFYAAFSRLDVVFLPELLGLFLASFLLGVHAGFDTLALDPPVNTEHSLPWHASMEHLVKIWPVCLVEFDGVVGEPFHLVGNVEPEPKVEILALTPWEVPMRTFGAFSVEAAVEVLEDLLDQGVMSPWKADDILEYCQVAGNLCEDWIILHKFESHRDDHAIAAEVRKDHILDVEVVVKLADTARVEDLSELTLRHDCGPGREIGEVRRPLERAKEGHFMRTAPSRRLTESWSDVLQKQSGFRLIDSAENSLWSSSQTSWRVQLLASNINSGPEAYMRSTCSASLVVPFIRLPTSWLKTWSTKTLSMLQTRTLLDSSTIDRKRTQDVRHELKAPSRRSKRFMMRSSEITDLIAHIVPLIRKF
jgi:hypothetical protein